MISDKCTISGRVSALRQTSSFWLPRLASRGLYQSGLVTQNEADPWAVRRSWPWQVNGQNKALGELRLQVSGGAQKEAKLVGSTAGQKEEGASGKWLMELGLRGCVCACACVWEGPQEVAAEAGDDNGVYMSQGRLAGLAGRAFDVRLCVKVCVAVVRQVE